MTHASGKKDSTMTEDGFIGAIVFGGLALWGAYTGYNYLNGTGGCEQHASAYSCWYLDAKADYDVHYWKNLRSDDKESEDHLIASVKGLPECRRRAIAYANKVGEPWNERAYICGLVVDGEFKEQHRYIE